jgi:hypothetical protein
MPYTRREFGAIAVTGVAGAAAMRSAGTGLTVFAQARPNSLIEGVQIGAITYSFRSMPDQSAEATLKYVVESGLSAIELMGGPAESFAGAPAPARPGGFGRGPGGPPPAPAPAELKGTWAGKPLRAAGRPACRRTGTRPALRSLRNSRRRSRSRRASSRRGGRAYRWTRSSACARCTTTRA